MSYLYNGNPHTWKNYLYIEIGPLLITTSSMHAPSLSRLAPRLGVVIKSILLTDTSSYYPDSKGHGAHLGPTRGWQDPGGPHVGPMNLSIRVHILRGHIIQLGFLKHAICITSLLNHSFVIACSLKLDHCFMLTQGWLSGVLMGIYGFCDH